LEIIINVAKTLTITVHDKSIFLEDLNKETMLFTLAFECFAKKNHENDY